MASLTTETPPGIDYTDPGNLFDGDAGTFGYLHQSTPGGSFAVASFNPARRRYNVLSLSVKWQLSVGGEPGEDTSGDISYGDGNAASIYQGFHENGAFPDETANPSGLDTRVPPDGTVHTVTFDPPLKARYCGFRHGFNAPPFDPAVFHVDATVAEIPTPPPPRLPNLPDGFYRSFYFWGMPNGVALAAPTLSGTGLYELRHGGTLEDSGDINETTWRANYDPSTGDGIGAPGGGGGVDSDYQVWTEVYGVLIGGLRTPSAHEYDNVLGVRSRPGSRLPVGNYELRGRTAHTGTPDDANATNFTASMPFGVVNLPSLMEGVNAGTTTYFAGRQADDVYSKGWILRTLDNVVIASADDPNGYTFARTGEYTFGIGIPTGAGDATAGETLELIAWEGAAGWLPLFYHFTIGGSGGGSSIGEALYAIEFWYSYEGVPNSFYPLAVIPEAEDGLGFPAGLPINASHTPLRPGSRWYYKVRRVFFPEGNSAPIYSDFSAVREAVAPGPVTTKGNDMDSIFGTSTVLGIGIQPFTEPHDKPRKAKWVVENPSGRVRKELQTFASRALRNTTARRMKTGAGRATFPFSIPIEATPNGTLSTAHTMLFGAPTTTRVGGTAVTLTANAASGATSLTVTALAADIPSGSVLNFSVNRTTTLSANAAAGATTLAVAAIPSAIAINTPVNVGGVWFRVTAAATSGATSLTISALPADLLSGATLAYTQNRYLTTSALAAAAATAVPVVATGFALVTTDSALYGFKYRHEWTNNKRYNIATFSQLVGDYVEVSPGAFANQFEWTVDFEMDTFLTPTLGGNALNQTRRYTLAQTGLDVALIDNLNPFSMIDCRVVIGGIESEDVKSATVTVNRNGRGKGALRRKRGMSRYTPSITDISIALNLYETSEAFTEKYFGHPDAQTEEYGITCKVVTQTVSIEFATCPITEGDLPYEWGVIVSKASIDADDDNIPGPDEVMEAVTLIPNWDAALGTDATFYLVNDESLADIMTPAAPITPVPQNHVTAYSAP